MIAGMMPNNGCEMKVIGITGGVGSGKSALLGAISEEYKCRLLLADDIANFLKEPGQCCYGPLVELLGAEILDDKGHLDKTRMAGAIFGNQQLLEAVNAIVHPAVKKYIIQAISEEQKAGTIDICFVEAALFIEAGYRDLVDSLWYVYADSQTRVERLRKGRGYTIQKIHSIMEKQLQEEAFRGACDVVIDNSGSLEQTMKQVRNVLEKYEIM